MNKYDLSHDITSLDIIEKLEKNLEKKKEKKSPQQKDEYAMLDENYLKWSYPNPKK